MRAALPVCALVAGRKLAIAEELVRLRLRLKGEHVVDRARVDQERRLGRRQVFLRVIPGKPHTQELGLAAVATHLEVIGDLEQRGVAHGDRLDLVREREVEADTRTEAVAHSTELGHAVGLERGDDGARDLLDALAGVLAEPGHEVEVGAGVQRIGRDGVGVEEVGHDDLEAIAREVIGKELTS